MPKPQAMATSGRPVAATEAVVLSKSAGVDFCRTIFARKWKDVYTAARKLGYPVFLKVVSSPVKGAVHKSRQGLVAHAENEDSARQAFGRLAAAHAKLASKKVLERQLLVSVQETVTGLECIIGARNDSSFGPVVLFGSGGVLAEELGDTAIRLCPIDLLEAVAMIRGTKFFPRIKRLRNSDLAEQKLAAMLVKVSNFMTSRPDIAELDLNPVVVDDAGRAVAVDVRMVRLGGKTPTAKKQAEWRASAVPSFFSPGSVALIGASRTPESVGQAILRNLTIGCVHRCEYCRPFLGRIFPVNPFADELLGKKCYPSILKIQEQVDLAIIVLPRDIVLKAVDECVKKKVNAVIIISAGFGEFDEQGRKLQTIIAERLEKARIPLLGPNCLGIIRPAHNLNASFGPSTPPKGDVAFISQSGALADSIIDWAIQARYGFSAIVSYGNKAMLDCSHFFRFFANDPETKAVTIYLEGVNNGREFFTGLAGLARQKPVIVLKGGRTSLGTTAAATHTASLAGDARVFEAAVRQAGAFLAETVEELFDLAKALAEQMPCKANGVGVITNGGGYGVLCSDYCEELGVKLPQLRKETLAAFDKSGIMHPAYSRRNPLDIVGDALPERYELALKGVLEEPDIHGVIVIQTLQAMTNPVLDAKAIVEAHRQFPEKPIISCFMGGRFSRKGMHYLENMHIPDFNDVRKAVVAMKALVERGEFLAKAAPAATGMAKKGI